MGSAPLILVLPPLIMEHAQMQLDLYYNDNMPDHWVPNVNPKAQFIADFTEWLGLKLQELYCMVYVPRGDISTRYDSSLVLNREMVDYESCLYSGLHPMSKIASCFTVMVISRTTVYITPDIQNVRFTHKQSNLLASKASSKGAIGRPSIHPKDRDTECLWR